MDEILKIIASRTKPPRKVEELNPDEALQDLGIDSLNFLLLILDLESITQRGLFKPENVAELRTVGDLLDKVKVG